MEPPLPLVWMVIYPVVEALDVQHLVLRPLTRRVGEHSRSPSAVSDELSGDGLYARHLVVSQVSETPDGEVASQSALEIDSPGWSVRGRKIGRASCRER